MGIHERKEREREQRKEEIVNAAQTVFFEKGLQAATMDEIAEAAELSKGTLYLYYKSKEDLYLAVMVRGMELLYEMLYKVISSDKPIIEILFRLGETYSRFFHENRSYFRMFQFFLNPQMHKQVSDEMRETCIVAHHKIWKLVIGLLERGVREKVLKPDLNPSETTVMLWSNATSLMMRIDTEYDFWKTNMNIDLEKVLRLSDRLLLDAILSDQAKKEFRGSKRELESIST